jgi:hypothetical protein
LHSPLVIPDLRAAVRHAAPNVVEAKLVPFVLFVALLEFAGTRLALLGALAWTLAALAFRAATRRPVPGLVLLAAVTLAARTIAAIVTGSMSVYFLPPTITTVFVGLAFLVSVPLGTPLAQRLATDILPFDEATIGHPVLRSFFVRLSLLWACTSMVNAAITIWLMMSQSTTTFVVAKSMLGPLTAVATIGTMLIWLRVEVGRTGTPIIWARRTATAVA